jgi:hypothetical protein
MSAQINALIKHLGVAANANAQAAKALADCIHLLGAHSEEKPAGPAPLTDAQKARAKNYMEFGGMTQADAIAKVRAEASKSAPTAAAPKKNTPVVTAAAEVVKPKNQPGDIYPRRGLPSVTAYPDRNSIVVNGWEFVAGESGWTFPKGMTEDNFAAFTDKVLERFLEATRNSEVNDNIGPAIKAGGKGEQAFTAALAKRRAQFAEPSVDEEPAKPVKAAKQPKVVAQVAEMDFAEEMEDFGKDMNPADELSALGFSEAGLDDEDFLNLS